jgi:prephenate dehydrogenase
VATPIATLAAVVAEALEAAPGAVVTDAGSVKAPVVAEVARLAPGLASRFVGGHPMGGSERSGPDHASASVVDDIVWCADARSRHRSGAVDRSRRGCVRSARGPSGWTPPGTTGWSGS